MRESTILDTAICKFVVSIILVPTVVLSTMAQTSILVGQQTSQSHMPLRSSISGTGSGNLTYREVYRGVRHLISDMAQMDETRDVNQWMEPQHNEELSELMENEMESEEPERIETDRHDFTQSPVLVPYRMTQVEFGYSYFQRSDDGTGDEDTHTGPELLIRYGLRPNLEFRIRYNEVWQFGDEDRQGSEDLRFALKTRVSDQLRWRPESALELRMSVPTGSDDWSTGEVEFGLDYIYGWKLNRRTEFYGSTGFSTNALGEFGFAAEHPDEHGFELFTQSFALGTELTEHITIYNEIFGLFTDGFEDDERNPVFYNIGVDYYVNDNFVLDVRAGTGLNDDAEDFFFGMGGGIRF